MAWTYTDACGSMREPEVVRHGGIYQSWTETAADAASAHWAVLATHARVTEATDWTSSDGGRGRTWRRVLAWHEDLRRQPVGDGGCCRLALRAWSGSMAASAARAGERVGQMLVSACAGFGGMGLPSASTEIICVPWPCTDDHGHGAVAGAGPQAAEARGHETACRGLPQAERGSASDASPIPNSSAQRGSRSPFDVWPKFATCNAGTEA